MLKSPFKFFHRHKRSKVKNLREVDSILTFLSLGQYGCPVKCTQTPPLNAVLAQRLLPQNSKNIDLVWQSVLQPFSDTLEQWAHAAAG
jgi:hypothetical protein